MLIGLQNSKWLNFFWGMMSCLLLNSSVDVVIVGFNDNQSAKFINEQETIAEMFVEQALGFENAIPENEENDTDPASLLKKNKSIDFFDRQFCKEALDKSVFQKQQFFIAAAADFAQPFSETFSPPPEA